MAACAQCGEINPERARFCLACGSPIAAPAATAAEERKLVTAVFVDLVGFTSRSERLDPEDVHAVQAPYHALLRTELERYGGTVEKFIGDAVMALFGAPHTREDDAERAVRAALAIRDGIARLNEAYPAFDLHIRIGVNTGEALIALTARPSEGEGMASGDVVNTASRLQSNAPVDGILVGDATQRAVAHAFELRPVEPIQAKGKAEPVAAWEVVAARERVTRPALGAPLVGRTAELEELLAFWTRIRTDGGVGIFTVVAPPGIGKSRLLAEVAVRLDRDADVHWGRCLSYGEGITYWPVIEIIKAASGIAATDAPDVVSEKLGRLLERLPTDDADTLRLIAAALANLLAVPTTPRGTFAADAITQNELHWGIRRLFELLAESRPLLLVFEDLHWAEPTLLELLAFIGDGSGRAPVLVLASARPELLETRASMFRPGVRRRVLELGALSEQESERLLVRLLGAEAPPEGIAAVLRTAGGNPLFLEETVRMVADRGGFEATAGADFQSLPVPSSLQSLIGARLDRLPAPAKEVAQRGSVVGQRFWSGLVSHLGGGDDVAEPLAVLDQHDVVHGLGRSVFVGEREWEFRHVLIRDVAYARLPKRRRAALHVRCAEWIERSGGQDLIEVVAYHFEQSCRLAREIGYGDMTPPVAQAVETLTLAAEKAERREGLREAERFYARALDLTDPDDNSALDLRLRHGRALIALGDFRQATEELVQLRDAATAAGDDRIRSGALIALANIHGKQGRGAEALELLDDARRLAAACRDPALQIRVAYEVSFARGWFEDAATDAVADLRWAVALAEEIGDRSLTIEGHQRLGMVLFNMGRLEESDELLTRCLGLASQLGSRRDEARAMYSLGYVKYYRGSIDDAEQLGLQAEALLERVRETHMLLQNIRALAKYALARGDAETAERRLRDHLELATEAGGWLLVEFYRYLAEALIRQGRLSEAAQAAHAARATLPPEDAYASAAVLVAEVVTADAGAPPGATHERVGEALRLLEEHNLLLDLEEARLDIARAHGRRGDVAAAEQQLAVAGDALRRLGAHGPLEYFGWETGEGGAAVGGPA
jgi:class 3 adenylate cyclase/tetratricopeptide (TPR) repeat protein